MFKEATPITLLISINVSIRNQKFTDTATKPNYIFLCTLAFCIFWFLIQDMDAMRMIFKDVIEILTNSSLRSVMFWISFAHEYPIPERRRLQSAYPLYFK